MSIRIVVREEGSAKMQTWPIDLPDEMKQYVESTLNRSTSTKVIPGVIRDGLLLCHADDFPECELNRKEVIGVERLDVSMFWVTIQQKPQVWTPLSKRSTPQQLRANAHLRLGSLGTLYVPAAMRTRDQRWARVLVSEDRLCVELLSEHTKGADIFNVGYSGSIAIGKEVARVLIEKVSGGGLPFHVKSRYTGVALPVVKFDPNEGHILAAMTDES